MLNEVFRVGMEAHESGARGQKKREMDPMYMYFRLKNMVPAFPENNETRSKVVVFDQYYLTLKEPTGELKVHRITLTRYIVHNTNNNTQLEHTNTNTTATNGVSE